MCLIYRNNRSQYPMPIHSKVRILKLVTAMAMSLFTYSSIAQSPDVDSELGPLPQLDGDVVFTGSCKAVVCQGQYRADIDFDSINKRPVSGGRISSHYGWRRHPITQQYRMHTGIDYAVPIGTPVVAAQHGKVVFVGRQGGYGNLVVIKHNDTYRTVYAHLDRFKVNNGDWVEQGQVIALSGNTGLSTGPHLHYEIRKNGLSLNPLTGESQSNHILTLKQSNQSTLPKGQRAQRQANGRVRTIIK